MNVYSQPAQSAPLEASAAEAAIRIDLAACYRLVALYGWDDLIFTHISARVPGPERAGLIRFVAAKSPLLMIVALRR